MTDSRTELAPDHSAIQEPLAFSTWPGARPDQNSRIHKQRPALLRWFLWLGAFVAMLLLLVPLVIFAQVYRQSRASDAHPADAIVVLGAAQFNGIPSQVFRSRLDTAYDLYQQGLAPYVVITGGRIYGDQYTEAEAGRNYLVERGMPADVILMENISHNTAASFDGVQRLLQPRGIESLLLVSDGFHLYRSEMLARDAGFESYGFAAQGSPIRHGSMTEFRYMLRETLGVLAWKLHIKR